MIYFYVGESSIVSVEPEFPLVNVERSLSSPLSLELATFSESSGSGPNINAPSATDEVLGREPNA